MRLRRALKRLFHRCTSWARASQDEEILRAEIEQHIALQTAENVRTGLSPSEARRQAMLKFGALEAMKENYRDQRGLPSLERFIQDTRHALFLASQLHGLSPYDPGALLTAILALGLSVLIASLIPAFRASLTDPLEALRSE